MFFSRPKTFVMDINTLADPRVIQFLKTGLVTGRIIVPEPEQPKGENDHLNRRALENLNSLRNTPGIKLKTCPGIKTITDLIALARKNRATIITTRIDLKSQANGLPVVTTLELFELFRPAYLPGTVLRVRISKRGKERNEGIGYLEGGIKVVVENGGSNVGNEIEVVIKGSIDTDVGQVLFAQPRFQEIK